MKTATTITIDGMEFDGPFTDTGDLKNQQGIYVILDRRSDQKWYLIDVGESTDVKTRVESHDRKDCWKTNSQGTLGVAVCYTPGWTDSQRRQKESSIRDKFNPPCGER